MQRVILTIMAAAIATALASAPALAHHVELPGEIQNALQDAPQTQTSSGGGSWEPSDTGDDDRDGMSLLANLGLLSWSPGSDLAFQGDLAIAGNYGGGPSKHPGGFRVIDTAEPSQPRMIGDFECPGPQADVSVWRDLAFVSVDSAREAKPCTVVKDGKEQPTPAAPTAQFTAGAAYEGIRIVSIADPAHPRQIEFVNTDCGSHTHTLVPDTANKRLLIYVLSYPLGTPAVNCSAATHRKFSIVEVPLDDPTKARVIATPDVSPAIGCHDVTVFMPKKLAGAACLTESQVWDISDPAAPRILAHIPHPPGMQISHSSTFSWDGTKLVFGDEKGGAVAATGCTTGAHHAPLGALWFYDIRNPSAPQLRGRYKIPQERNSTPCTAHNFNTVPFKTSDRDVLTASWYHGGTALVDFTDMEKPRQLAYYIANGTAPDDLRSTPWSSYFYNGHIYANNFENGYPVDATARGFDVMRVDDGVLPPTVQLGRLNPQTQIGWGRGKRRSARR